MPHDVAFFDLIFPAVLVIFIACMIFQLLLDLWLGQKRFYRHVWHPPLFRLASFFCLFSLLSLLILPRL